MTAGENLSAEDLRQILTEVDGKKPAQRLMVAINYLEDDDLTQKEAAERYGYTGGWLSQWLDRLERLTDEPFEQVVYDEPRLGRPTQLSDAEHKQFVEALHESPEEVGIDAPAWSVPLTSEYLSEEFDVDHCNRHVRRLMTEAGLSWTTIRSEYYKSDERAQEAFCDELEKRRTIWMADTRSPQ